MSRVVLILGCSTGIGRAVMERLTVSGHAVVATARRAESFEGCCRFDRADAGCHRLGRHGFLPSP
jgi:NAD(P)-dependent dehydrogenase (short-subunit alcohol dehydrogenase family)